MRKNKSNSKDTFSELDPVHKAFFEQDPSEDFGHDWITNYWGAFLMILPLSFYLLLLIDNVIINWICLVYSIGIILLYVVTIYGIKKEMIYILNPFDFVAMQFINFIGFVFHYGFLFYVIYLIDKSQFIVTSIPNFFNFIYASVASVATIGFLDIFPNSMLTKGLTILELFISFWFLITMIPVALGLQTERIRQFTLARNKFHNELDKAEKEGRWKDITDKVITKKDKNKNSNNK